jgi:hypothetical protein
MSVIPALGKQKDLELKVTLDYILKPCLKKPKKPKQWVQTFMEKLYTLMESFKKNQQC